MRLNKASFAFAGAVTAITVTTLAASPAWACNDRDPALTLHGACLKDGQASWMVGNPNTWGAVPFTWKDDQGGHSDGLVQAPAGGSVAVPSHATTITVIAYRPDRHPGTVWEKHGAVSTVHCTATPPSHTPSAPPKPAPKPTTHAPAPQPKAPSAPPSGEARPATPVKAQPQFTG